MFFTISGVLVFGGLTLFFLRGKSKYDIEFTGGTSVQINLKPDVSLTRQNVEDRIAADCQELGNPDLQAVSVYSVGEPTGQAPNGEKIYDQYEITTPATNKLQTTVTFNEGSPQTVETVTAAIRKAEQATRASGSGRVRGDCPAADKVLRRHRQPRQSGDGPDVADEGLPPCPGLRTQGR